MTSIYDPHESLYVLYYALIPIVDIPMHEYRPCLVVLTRAFNSIPDLVHTIMSTYYSYYTS